MPVAQLYLAAYHSFSEIIDNNMNKDTITVTSPLLPNLDEFSQ